MGFTRVFVLCVCLCLPSTMLAVENDKKVVLTTHIFFPYSYYQNDQTFRGSAVDVVTCAFEKMGWSLDIRVVPWKRAQITVWEGQADGFFAASQNFERDQKARMSDVIAEQNWTWYVHRNSGLRPDSPEFKATAHVSSFNGANMHQWLIDEGYNVASKPPHNSLQLVQMLLSNRFDAILANELVMQSIIEQQKLHTELDAVVARNKPLGVYFSNEVLKKHPRLLEKFNQQVPACRDRVKDNIYIAAQK